ncbi:MAG: DUF5060 domain-containing protein [Planctomycetota bacterium]|jgi:hypothetical protein
MYKIAWIVLIVVSFPSIASADTAKQWEPIEWTFKNPTYEGNPYDLIASATFTHKSKTKKITTEMFYDGADTWKLRFTGTEPGIWTFITKSSDSELNGLKGTVKVEPNPGVSGFITNYGNKWGRLGVNQAFVPQYVMFTSPDNYYAKPKVIDEYIKVFFKEHGFNGFHTSALCRWFDLDKTRYKQIDSPDPNPDPCTFEALELLIKKVHAAGGVVHIWAWGDEQRTMTPIKWGINGKVDRRLQRYICARLGPLPGWSMGYGFDLQEWVKPKQLQQWHKYMHQHLGWFHFLGARAPKMTQIYGGLDYSSYQQHRPTYETYVKAIERKHPGKPSFFEDRFRIRKKGYPEKDYNPQTTRRGLWHSTLAGGAANIWGHLTKPTDHLLSTPQSDASAPYPNKDQLLTYSRFWKNRFKKEMVRDNKITDGLCLRVVNSFYIFYKEDASQIQMDLSKMKAPQKAIAVDTKKPYQEIPLITYQPGKQLFKAPHKSDWAIAVGKPQ